MLSNTWRIWSSGTYAPKPLNPTNIFGELVHDIHLWSPKTGWCRGVDTEHLCNLEAGKLFFWHTSFKLLKLYPAGMLYISNSKNKLELLLPVRHHTKICFCIHSNRSIIWIVNFQGYDGLWVNRGVGRRIIKNRAKTENQIEEVGNHWRGSLHCFS